MLTRLDIVYNLSLIHISEPTRPTIMQNQKIQIFDVVRMPARYFEDVVGKPAQVCAINGDSFEIMLRGSQGAGRGRPESDRSGIRPGVGPRSRHADHFLTARRMRRVDGPTRILLPETWMASGARSGCHVTPREATQYPAQRFGRPVEPGDEPGHRGVLWIESTS